MTKPPNFLFIMTDQHRADWLGCYGHPVVKTPNLDALAARGVKFTDFHVATPVCMPNRASFVTGRYPTLHGLRYNGCNLPARSNTFVDVLRSAGYKTASIGKSHLQPFLDLPAKHATAGSDSPIPEAWKDDTEAYDNEEPTRYQGARKHGFPSPYYGFDHVDIVTGHGDKAGGYYQQWFRENHSNWQELIDPANELDHTYTCPQAFRTPIPVESYPTAYIKEQAKEYLRQNAQSAAPLFSYVSFPDPHHPFNPPGKYWDMYSPDAFDVPVTYSDHQNPPPPLEFVRQEFQSGAASNLATTTFMADDQHIREAMALTAGMITMIDDAVGEIIETLQQTGQMGNTIVMFNADHGDYLGDFNLMLKGAWPKESITRVPMIWADPMGPRAKQVSELASTIDLSATILERAALTPYFGMQGESLLKMMSGQEKVRDSLLIEFNDMMARMGFEDPARVRTLLTKEWHLSIYKDQNWGELYNRRSDPNHLENLWDHDAHRQIRSDLMGQLANHLIGLMDESPRSTRIA